MIYTDHDVVKNLSMGIKLDEHGKIEYDMRDQTIKLSGLKHIISCSCVVHFDE